MLRRPVLLLSGLAVLALVAAACSSSSSSDDESAATTTTQPPSLDDTMRMNQIQVIGTHNSYHISNFDVIGGTSPAAVALDYTHAPLTEELDGGLRTFELDIWLQDGKFHVLHFPAVDPLSTCDLFTECLTELHDWSTAHPDHVPLSVDVEVEDTAEALGAAGMDQIDTEIRSVWPDDEIVLPDDVRGDHATLPEALPDGWPTLGESRGRIMFGMDNESDVRDLYTAGHPALEGRVLFTPSVRGRPDAAFIKLNEPTADRDKIERLVAAGYVVRTRADADLLNAQAGIVVDRHRAFVSGAQWVSTDYPATEPPAPHSGYTVEFPGGGYVRCNPVNAPGNCDDAFIAADT